MGEKPPSDPHSPDSYLTLAGPGTSEHRVQRSRFLGFAQPVAGEGQARQVIAEISRRQHDARHVCFAWRLGLPPDVAEIRNDDGEPGGSAGEPLLTSLRKTGASNALAVVVRYFGGVKLGTGGLARAYGEAAEAAVAAAGIRKILLGKGFQVRFPYAQQKTLSRLLEKHEGHPLEQDFGAEVVWKIWLPHSRWRGFSAELTEATAATVMIEPAPELDGQS